MSSTTRTGKTPKCKHCGEWVDKQLDHEKTNKGYFHRNCFEVTSMDGQHYKELIECVCNNFNMQRPSALILAQIKNLKEKKDFKYKGMQMTIEYLIEVEGFAFSEVHTSGIQMIEWYYQKARDYYMSAQTAIDTFKDVEVYQEPVQIIIKRVRKHERPKLIDMTTL